MKQKLQFGLIALLLAMTQRGVQAQTTFFTDNFSNGSTTNLASVRGGSPTASHTSYDIGASKTTIGYCTVTPNDLHLTLSAATTSGFWEAQALFATNGNLVTLSTIGDYIDISVVFTNTGGTLLAGGVKSALWMGLYNSGGSAPLSGGILANSGLTTTAGSAYATGNCANWQGYVASVTSGGTSRAVTRPVQNGALTDSADQDLVGNGASSGTYANPGGTAIETAPVTTFSLTSGGQYTMELRLTVVGLNSLMISNFLYTGSSSTGAVLFSQGSATGITNATYLTGGFDGLGIGAFNSGTSFDPTMDISSIQITGQSTVVTTPPTITAQPVPVTVAANGACEFTVSAVGVAVTYQWYRNGTILNNGGDIAGATSSSLIVSPATVADVASTANGYYCKVSGAGGYSTNSTTNSLALVTAKNLVWTAVGGSVWDLNNTVSWEDSSLNPQSFNYGDSVRFDDTASSTFVTLTGNFLSASTMTVDSESGRTYSFTGAGSFAGPGSLIYTGTGQLTLNVANSYSGGTLVSNTVTPAASYVYLENYNGLGTGPVTLDNAGGTMEIVPGGGPTSGINGNINVLDDFTIQADVPGTYSAVFLGDLAGTAGKTLTINPKTGGLTNRFRAYGINTVDNANLVLDTVDGTVSQAIYNGTVLAPYGASGSQTYNGIISGVGGIAQRGTGTTFLNGQNTYSGGTFATAGTIAFGTDTTVSGGSVVSGPIGTGPLFVSPEVGSANGSGTIIAANGTRTIASPIQYPSATNNQTLIIGGTNNLILTGEYDLNGLDGTTPAVSRTLQLNNSNCLITISGVIADGGAGFGLIKTGTGTLALNNTETYTGATLIGAGTVLVNGQLAAGSSVTVSNATLGGTGTIAGPVTETGTNSFISPGSPGVATLTFGNNLSIGGNVAFYVNKSLAISNGLISVSGTLANTGTGNVTVSNLGPAVVVGDRFVLFSKPLSNGAALTVSGLGLNWTNRLAVDGSITALSVISTVSTNAFTLTNRYSAGTLTLAWPVNHTGYRLQAETNSLAVGLATNWVTVSSVGGVNPSQTNQVSIPVSGNSPAVFFRLIYP